MVVEGDINIATAGIVYCNSDKLHHLGPVEENPEGSL